MSTSPLRQIFAAACAAIGIFAFNASAQTTCDAVPGQILLDLVTQSQLPAIAAQYGLDPTPIDQAGTPPTYRMRILASNPQNPCQIAAVSYTHLTLPTKRIV